MNEQELYDYAISLLAKKDYSSGDMTRLLTRLTENHAAADAVMNRLMANSYLDDVRLINYLINKHIKKAHGPTRIRQEIRQKGFPQELIEQALSRVEVDWYALARELKVRKFGEDLPAEYQEKNKQIRYLQYRGFSMDMISEALS